MKKLVVVLSAFAPLFLGVNQQSLAQSEQSSAVCRDQVMRLEQIFYTNIGFDPDHGFEEYVLSLIQGHSSATLKAAIFSEIQLDSQAATDISQFERSLRAVTDVTDGSTYSELLLACLDAEQSPCAGVKGGMRDNESVENYLVYTRNLIQNWLDSSPEVADAYAMYTMPATLEQIQGTIDLMNSMEPAIAAYSHLAVRLNRTLRFFSGANNSYAFSLQYAGVSIGQNTSILVPKLALSVSGTYTGNRIMRNVGRVYSRLNYAFPNSLRSQYATPAIVTDSVVVWVDFNPGMTTIALREDSNASQDLLAAIDGSMYSYLSRQVTRDCRGTLTEYFGAEN